MASRNGTTKRIVTGSNGRKQIKIRGPVYPADPWLIKASEAGMQLAEDAAEANGWKNIGKPLTVAGYRKVAAVAATEARVPAGKRAAYVAEFATVSRGRATEIAQQIRDGFYDD